MMYKETHTNTIEIDSELGCSVYAIEIDYTFHTGREQTMTDPAEPASIEMVDVRYGLIPPKSRTPQSMKPMPDEVYTLFWPDAYAEMVRDELIMSDRGGWDE